MISSLFVIPWKGTEPTGWPRKDQRPTLLLRDYIGDSSNALVRVAFEQFDQTPPTYNPIVLYGPPGTGKTHLSWMLAATFGANSKTNSAHWTTGADFVRQVSHAIEADSIVDFRRKMLAAPALLVDGLDRIAGRESAQLELLVLLDECVRQGVPFLATSPTMPLEVENLSAPLASRLQEGLVIPLAAPGPSARQHLLGELATRQRVTLTTEMTRRLADLLQKSQEASPTVMELNEFIGEVRRLGADATNSQLIDCVQEFAKRWATRPGVSLRSVSTAVANYFGIKPVELKGPSRKQMVVRARGVAIYLGRRLAGESLDRLGEHFGGRDHSTALHAVRKTEELIAEDPTLRKAVDDLTQQLHGEASS